MVIKFIEFDNNDKKNNSEYYYKKLSKEDRAALDKFEESRRATAGENRAKKAKANAIRFLAMVKKPVKNVKLEDLQKFLASLKESKTGDYFKNDVKGFVRNFLEWKFKDTAKKRFNDFSDIVFDRSPERKQKIEPEDTLEKEDVRNLIRHEKSPFYKAFISTQYKCALRTKECRTLKKDWIEKESEDIWWLNVPSKKNRLGKVKIQTAPPLDAEGIKLLKELFEWQENEGIESEYVFPGKEDQTKPISSGAVSKWFSALTKKVLGKQKKSYILRHSFANVLRMKVMNGKLAKSEAAKLMRHSEKMFDETYYNVSEKKRRELLKHQLLGVEDLPEEKKHELEIENEKLWKTVGILEKRIDMWEKGTPMNKIVNVKKKS